MVSTAPSHRRVGDGENGGFLFNAYRMPKLSLAGNDVWRIKIASIFHDFDDAITPDFRHSSRYDEAATLSTGIMAMISPCHS